MHYVQLALLDCTVSPPRLYSQPLHLVVTPSLVQSARLVVSPSPLVQSALPLVYSQFLPHSQPPLLYSHPLLYSEHPTTVQSAPSCTVTLPDPTFVQLGTRPLPLWYIQPLLPYTISPLLV